MEDGFAEAAVLRFGVESDRIFETRAEAATAPYAIWLRPSSRRTPAPAEERVVRREGVSPRHFAE